MNWCSKGDETEAEWQRGREHRDKVNLVKWDEMWGEVFWHFEWNWAEVGLVLSQTVRSAFFFFFFLNFGRFSRYGRFRPESGRIGPSRIRVGSRRHKSMKTTWDPRGTTRSNARATASPARRRVRHGCGTSGAASVLPMASVTLNSTSLGRKMSQKIKLPRTKNRMPK